MRRKYQVPGANDKVKPTETTTAELPFADVLIEITLLSVFIPIAIVLSFYFHILAERLPDQDRDDAL
jgi:hypothetical protein